MKLKNDVIHFVFFDLPGVKLYKYESKVLQRVNFKVKGMDVDKLYYSYEYDMDSDSIKYYPFSDKCKNINVDRTYYGNVININMLWEGYIKEISKYLPKMGKLMFIIGRLDIIGDIDKKAYVYKEKLNNSFKLIFKDRLIGVTSFTVAAFMLLLTLKERYNKNIVLIANSFYMVCSDENISSTFYETDKLINDYASRLDIAELFYGKYEIKKIVHDLLIKYLSYEEAEYEVFRQNVSAKIDMENIKKYYQSLLGQFVNDVSRCEDKKDLLVIDVTSKKNRIVMDFFNLLKTSPYKVIHDKYVDFVSDSLIYAYIVCLKNKINDKAIAKKIIFDEAVNPLFRQFSDGFYIYNLKLILSGKSVRQVLGEHIKKINVEE